MIVDVEVRLHETVVLKILHWIYIKLYLFIYLFIYIYIYNYINKYLFDFSKVLNAIAKQYSV